MPTVEVLGPTRVHDGGAAMALRPRERHVLSALAAHGHRPVEVGELIEALWADPPATALMSLRTHVTRLRRALGAEAVCTTDGGYALAQSWEIDARAFDRDVARARRAHLTGDRARQRQDLRRALARWRGTAYADLPHGVAAARERARLHELRLLAEEHLIEATLATGDLGAALELVAAALPEHPERESRWLLAVLVRYRAGQRRAALATLDDARRGLAEAAGLSPGPALARLERMVLDDDPELAHLDLAGVLEGSAPHLLAAARTRLDQPVHVALDAARLAASAGLHPVATQLYQRAEVVVGRRHPPGSAEELALRVERGDHLRQAGDPAGAEVLWEAARDASDAGRHHLAAAALTSLCRLGPTSASGSVDPALAEVIRTTLAHLDEPAAVAALAGPASLVHSMAGDHRRCRALFDRALRCARATGSDAVLAGTLPYAYMAVTEPWALDEREALATEALALAERLDDEATRFEALHLLFSVQLQRAHPALWTTHRQLVAVVEELADHPRRWSATYQEAALAHLSGRLDEAEAAAERCLDFAPGVASSRVTASYGVQVLAVRLHQGRGHELAPVVDDIIQQQPSLVAWRAVSTYLAARAGDHDRARDGFEAIEAGGGLPPDATWSGAAYLCARAAARVGDPADRQRWAERLGPSSGRMTWVGSCSLGPVDVALAELAAASGDPRGAAHHLGVARRVVGGVPAPVFAGELDALADAVG